MSVQGGAVAATGGTIRTRAAASAGAHAIGLLTLFAMLTGLAACHRGKAAAVAAPTPALAPLERMARLYYDNGGGIQDSLRMVVRDAATFGNLWKRATSQQDQPPPVPNVEFDHQMVLVAGAGRMTPEDQIQMDSVGVRKEAGADGKVRDVLTAYVRTIVGCHRFNAAAYPLEIVQVRRFDGPVRFAETRVTPTNCR